MFSSTTNRDSLGESMYSSSSSENRSLSSTITSLEDFDFFRKDSLFSDSDGEVQEECNQDGNQGGYNTDMQNNVFEKENVPGPLTFRNEGMQKIWQNQEIREGNTNNVLISNEKICHHPERYNVDQQIVGADNDAGADEYDSSTPLSKITEGLDSCSLEQNTNTVKYNYETFCDCDEKRDDCLTTQHCCNVTQTTDTVYEDRRSPVQFMLTPEYSEDGGMNLYSIEQGHFIEIIDTKSKYTSRMSIRHNDKILGINYHAIQSFNHDIVLEMFSYLLHPPTEESISLVVERKDEYGNMSVLEINIKAEVITRGKPAVMISAHIYYSKPVKLNIKCVVMKNCYDLRIERGGDRNVFVMADKGGLCIRHLKHGNENKSIFKYFIFSGLCMTSGRRARPIFIAVFQSCENHKFIMAASRSKLSLVNVSGKLNTSVSRITKADPRFFIVHKTGDDHIYCESLLFRGSFWAVKGQGLQLAKRTETEILMRNDSLFDIIEV